ncbi:unnamed protein product, partial [Rotaria magnacalcarata]
MKTTKTSKGEDDDITALQYSLDDRNFDDDYDDKENDG